MRKLIWIVPAIGLLAGCSDLAGRQGMGPTSGRASGVLAADTFLGHDTTGNCVYQRPDGSRFAATCS